jgi:hypothetical protein
MLHRQRVQFGDDLPMPPRPHVGIDACFERGQTDLVQSRDLTIESRCPSTLA